MRKDAMILDEKENKIGHIIRATTEKSKFCAWPRKCEFKVDFGVGIIDRHEEIAQLALDYEVVKKPSSVTHEYGDRKWVGFAKYCDGIKDDPELALELEKKISEARDNKSDKRKKDQESLNEDASEDTDSDSDEPKKRSKKVKS